MASRSSGAGWFVVGFLAGVGATLAAIIFATRPQPTHVAIPAMSSGPAAPVVTYHAPAAPYGQEGAPPAASAAPAPAAPGATPPPAATSDLQTQEDAAAAGMTSRTRPGG